MQSVSSRNWASIGVSISNDDNLYTTGTSYAILHIMHIICIKNNYLNLNLLA